MCETMNNYTNNPFTVLGGIYQNPVVRALVRLRLTDESTESERAFLRAVFEEDAQDGLLEYLSQLILYDENPFSRACARGNAPSAYLVRAMKDDLALLYRLATVKDDRYRIDATQNLFGFWDGATVKFLQAYYAQNGYGAWMKYRAFRFSGGTVSPIFSPSSVALSDLKEYAREKAEVRDNLENFLCGFPFSDMLLYGDRGTGKSSTVHAMVNEFFSQKLRLVEIAKEDLLSLPALKTQLSEIPMKFLIFIDDFSLSEDDPRFSTLKACLQGTMEGHADNVMIVATSNRRHIVEENFDTRKNSIHAGDSEQELLSLSDRFGITVLFSAVNKQTYQSILLQMARDESLPYSEDQLQLYGERWAILHGGRSPRRAKQLMDYLIACKKKGILPQI